MAQYRTLEPVSYVKNGVVVSVDADRIIDIDVAQAEVLVGKVASVDDDRSSSMFPDGVPILNPVITRDVPVPSFTPDPVVDVPAPPAPKAEPKADPKKPQPGK